MFITGNMTVWRYWNLTNILVVLSKIMYGSGSNRLLHWCVCTMLSICRILWTKTLVTL